MVLIMVGLHAVAFHPAAMRGAILPWTKRWQLGTVLLLASSCAGPHIQIFSIAPPAPVAVLEDPVYFGGIILSTTPRASDVFHVTLPGPRAPEFHLTERSPAGALVRDMALPPYYVNPSWPFVAVSPDGNRLAYLRTDGNLYAYDLDGRVESMLLTGVGQDAFLGGLAWADAGHLVLVLNRGHGPGSILAIDTAGRRIVATREIENPSHFAISESGRLLAVTQMVRGSGIEIFDLPALTVAHEIANENARSWMGLLAWNPSASRLAYLDADNGISVLTLGAGPPVRIAKIPDHHVCSFLAFPNDETLVYKCQLPFGSHQRAQEPDEDRLSFLDIASGRVTETIVAEQVNSCTVVSSRTQIACEVLGEAEVRRPPE
jgi:hypothetical protein